MTRGALPRFIGLYAALYAAFGVESPFFPALLGSRGLGPEAIGVVLAMGTAARLLAGPLAGRLADRVGAPRGVLAACTGAAAVIGLGYLGADGLWPLVLVSVLHAASLAPITPLSDTLALAAASPAVGRGFPYGWVRGAGSAAFIVGASLSGQAVGALGLGVVIWLNAALLAVAVLFVAGVPRPSPSSASAVPGGNPGFAALLRLPGFVPMLAVAALVQGSHALHYGFAVIRWSEAGIGPEAAGLLWSEAVLAEVAVFVVLGPPLLDRLGPARTSALCAGAGVLRWAVMTQTAWWPAMALVQPLHGLTFALQHLACMRLIQLAVPPHLAATAQAVYGTVAVAAASAVLTLLSGPLYAGLGGAGFWVMAALCAAAAPLSLRLGR